MKRLSEDEVEYESDEERRAAAFFETILDNGVNVPRAIEMVRSCPPFVNLSDEFFEWLAQ